MRLAAVFFLLASPVFAQQIGGAAVIGGKAALGGGTGNTPNTFTLVNKTTRVACTGSTSCSVSLTSNGFSGSTGTNHLMVITSINNSDSLYVTAVSGAGTWTCPASVQTHFNGSVSGCYNLSSTSGVSTLTLTLTDTSSYLVIVKEYSFTQATASLDVASSGSNTGSGSSLTGVTLSLTGSSDVIEQWIVSLSSNPSAISSPYGNLQSGAAFGDADNQNTASGTAPTWTVATSTTCAIAAMAFK